MMRKTLRFGQSVSDRIRFFLNRLRERLWVKPLIFCLLSILAAFLAGMADRLEVARAVPGISSESIQTLLSIMSSSMLVIAVFAVGAMISAYASASRAATPRSLPVVIADDVSQNALSTFIGAFIFSIIAQVALLNGYYETAGRFVLFLITIFVFGTVIIGFVRWVDRIARLGRLGATIDKVEQVVADALYRRRMRPTLGAVKAAGGEGGVAIYADEVGYVQRVDLAILQSVAENNGFQVSVTALPGTFASPGQPLAYVHGHERPDAGDAASAIMPAFIIGDERTFDEDPRFGLIVLSEIASRALSPAVNDPGTAIDIIGTLVRLFTIWFKAGDDEVVEQDVEFDRVAVPEISLNDMFDDAFNALSRDGASTLEVAIRLQKAFRSLAWLGDDQMRTTAVAHARLALRHSELALQLPDELDALRTTAGWIDRR